MTFRLIWIASFVLAARPLAAGDGAGPAPDALLPGPVVLHTALRESAPAADSEVEGPVSELRLVFTEPVKLALSRVRIRSPLDEIDVGEIRYVTGSEGRALLVPLARPLGPGAYTVSWRTMGADSHPVRGTFEFSVVGSP